jgi:hypothetical protein
MVKAGCEEPEFWLVMGLEASGVFTPPETLPATSGCPLKLEPATGTNWMEVVGDTAMQLGEYVNVPPMEPNWITTVFTSAVWSSATAALQLLTVCADAALVPITARTASAAPIPSFVAVFISTFPQ